MNNSHFPGFSASSHPDKLRVQKETYIEVKVEEEIRNIINKLKYIETTECRAIMDKEMIDNKRKEYTMIFKTLLQIKERQNVMAKIND
jgi:hypothetical protein